MSYILEALKKSQQERDLGRVPTLETPAFASEGTVAAPSHWGAAAVTLAGVAVLIALYAALRGAPPPSEEVMSAPAPAQPAAEPAAMPPGGERAAAEAAPAVGAPLPAAAPTPPPPAPAAAAPRSSTPPPAPKAAPAPRQSAPPPSPVAEHEPEPVAPPAAGPLKVPEDLRQDIEAFKEQVRQERGGGKKPVKSEAKVPPQELRLPRDVAQRMPAFLMTVHIYDAEPAKRFVLINARKIREGGATRDGIQVEEILPDGAVLSYDGHRFFQHR